MIRHRQHSARACARCRKRKTKCDLKTPACTNCRNAKVDCKGYDPLTASEAPRSLVKHLEKQVHELESRIQEYERFPQNISAVTSSNVARSILSIAGSWSPSFFYASSSSSSPPLFLHPSCPPLPVARSSPSKLNGAPDASSQDTAYNPSTHPSKPQRLVQPTNLNSVPRTALYYITQNYTDVILPQYPIIDGGYVWRILDKILKEHSGDTEAVLAYGISSESGLTHFDYFAIFMSLAISLTTLTWRSEFRATAAADSFCASAFQHLDHVVQIDLLHSLQVSLLLTHYAEMNPEKADNWTCIANATSLALDLGLHKGSKGVKDQFQARRRQRIFWVVYAMERSLCVLLRLPLTFAEESIATELEMFTDNTTDFDETLENHIGKKSSANHIYLLRKIETEVHRVLYLREDVPGMSGSGHLQDWLDDINARVEVWLQKADAFAEYRMLEFRKAQYCHTRLKIHRPNPRLPVRTNEDRQICLDICQNLVDDYRYQSEHGRLFWKWSAVHILFEVAVTMLDACWSSRTWLPLRTQALHVLSVYLSECVALLGKVGERWKEAAMCSEFLEPVIGETRAAFEAECRGQSIDEELVDSITAKLNELLFPDTLTAWPLTPTNEQILVQTQLGDSGSVVADLGELEGFQWNVHWDLNDIIEGPFQFSTNDSFV